MSAPGPNKLKDGRAHQIEVRLGGGEVVIHRDEGAGLDEGLGKQVLASASLVSRQQILVAENLLDRVCQLVKALRAGIGVIGQQHGGLLIVAHGIGAAIGQHIHENVAGAKKKCVVASFFHCLEPLAGRANRTFCTTRILCISIGISVPLDRRMLIGTCRL